MNIELKHTSSRKLALAGSPAGLALAALWYLGRREVTAGTISAIHAKLSSEEFATLKSSVTAMPGWMNDAIRRYEGSRSDA
jgi:hypothetical protein